MSPKIQKIIKIIIFLLTTLAVLSEGVFTFFVIGAGIFAYNLSLFSFQFILILSLFGFWSAILIFLIIKRKNNRAINIVGFLMLIYFIIGIVIYFIGGESRGLTAFQRIASMLTVMVEWPMFLIVKLMFN